MDAYLPPHEDVVRILQLLVVKLIRVEGLCILVEGLELALDFADQNEYGETDPMWKDNVQYLLAAMNRLIKEVGSNPMLSIHIFISIPFPCQKWPLPADNFSSEECGQGWVFLNNIVDITRFPFQSRPTSNL